MKRMDEGRASLVEFLSSIKFDRQHGDSNSQDDSPGPFAPLQQRVRSRGHSAEDSQLVRSAN
jgi:hypothetical protein